MQHSRTIKHLLAFSSLTAAFTGWTTATLAQTPVPITQTLVPITSLYSTGVANDGSLLPDAAADPHYSLISSADTQHPGPNTYVVDETGYPIGNPWLPDGPNSKWIAPQADQDDSSGQGPGGDPPGSYIYQTTFDLSGLNPAAAVITGEWATDDFGTDILINGVSTGFTSHGPLPTDSGSTAFTAFTISSGFVSGINTLDFLVTNASPPGGENFNPTGLRVEMAGMASPVPEASTTVSFGLLLALGLGGRVIAAKRKKTNVEKAGATV